MLAQSVRLYRQRRNLSQKGLAFASGVTQATVSEIETAKSNPTVDVISRIAQTLEVPPFALFGAGMAIGALGGVMATRAIGDLVATLLAGQVDAVVGRWLVDELVGIAQTSNTSPRRVEAELAGPSGSLIFSMPVTLAILGPPGVGKTAVANSLLGADVLSVGANVLDPSVHQKVSLRNVNIIEVQLLDSVAATSDAVEATRAADCVVIVIDREPFRRDLAALDHIVPKVTASPRIVFVNKWDVQQLSNTESELKTLREQIERTMSKYVTDPGDIVYGSSLMKDASGEKKARNPLFTLVQRIKQHLPSDALRAALD